LVKAQRQHQGGYYHPHVLLLLLLVCCLCHLLPARPSVPQAAGAALQERHVCFAAAAYHQEALSSYG
jgi:hypothetical protein